jgi:hypothetical protein
VFADHEEVARREVGFDLATRDPGFDVLGAIINNHAHPPLWLKGVLSSAPLPVAIHAARPA